MTSTTSRSSSSTGPSRSCRNDDRRARGLRVQPGGRPPPRGAPRQRVPRRLRVRRESAGYGEPIGPARDARLRPLGPGGDRATFARGRDLAGRPPVLGPVHLGRHRPGARDPLPSASDTRVGLGSLYTLVWSIFIAYAVARYRYLVIEPVTELHTARAPRHRLERGLNYLVLENGRSAAMGAFRDIVSVTPGLCVTGLAPSRVTVRFGLERTPILWITTVTNGERTVRPNAVDLELVHTVVYFVRGHTGTAGLLEDVA